MASGLEIPDIDGFDRQQLWETLPRIDLESQAPEKMLDTSELVSPWISAEFGIIAVESTKRCLVLALMSPRGLDGVAVVKATSNREIIACAATSDSLSWAQRSIYGHLFPTNYLASSGKDSNLLSDGYFSPICDSSRRFRGAPGDPACSDRRLAGASGALLGERLRTRENLTSERLDEALRIQDRTGSRLGDVLVHWDLATDADVADALAEQARLPRTNLFGIASGGRSTCRCASRCCSPIENCAHIANG